MTSLITFVKRLNKPPSGNARWSGTETLTIFIIFSALLYVSGIASSRMGVSSGYLITQWWVAPAFLLLGVVFMFFADKHNQKMEKTRAEEATSSE